MKKLWLLLAVALMLFSGAGPVQADSLLFGYGLPTQNLNGVPDSDYPDRSNGSPRDFGTFTSPPATYKIEGDSFTIGSSGQQYQLTTGTVYMTFGTQDSNGNAITKFDNNPISTQGFPSLTLWAGTAGNISQVSTTYTLTRVWYTDGQNFQRFDASWAGIWQIDFTLNANINGGQKYYYFLGGMYDLNGTYQAPHLLGANALLGGVTPVGYTDDFMLYYGTGNGVISQAGQSIPSGYAKADVEIYGSQVPLPPTLLLFGSGLLGLAGWRRVRKG